MKYQICNGTVKYAATTVFERINFEIRNTEKIAVIGRNGCGKTSLLKLIAGIIPLDKLDSDEDSYITMEGHPSIGYLKQDSFIDESSTVEEELLKVFEPVFELEDRMNLAIKQMETDSSEGLLKQYSEDQIRFEALGGYTYRQDIDTIFTKFGFIPEDLSRPINTFSGGQKTKIAFVKLLLSRPDIMLLDEPTNHLDMPTIEWLEGYLKAYNKAVVIVSHDRMFLDKVADVTYEMEYKGMKRYPGNYTAFIERKRLNWEKQLKDFTAQQKEIERLTALVERFKNKPTKVAMTRSKLKQIEHMDKIDAPARFDLRSFHANFMPRVEGGREVLRIEKLKVGYDKVLCEVTLEIKKGQKIAIIGENGKGKSTLVKTLIGQLKPLGGCYDYGHQIETGYFDQQLAQYSGEKTVIDDFWDEYPDMKQTEVRNALGSFLFTKDDVFKRIDQLSGGEKVRLYLAKMLKRRPNFLILDEPTNHMDIVGKETLEAMLRNYSGTVLCVSHDRYFIKEIADSLLVFENGEVNYYPYGFDEYTQKSQKAEYKGENKPINLRPVTKALNPGKDLAKKEQKLAKLEKQIEECEKVIAMLKEELLLPQYASEFTALTRIQENMNKEEANLLKLMENWELVNES